MFVSTVCFTFVSFSDAAWVPLQLIFILLICLNLPFADSLYVAFIIGFLTDLHFMYVGLYMLIFLCIVLVFKMLQNRLFSYRNAVSSLFLAIIALLQYYLLANFFFAILHGVYRYAHLTSAMVDTITTVTFVLAYIIGFQCIVSGFSVMGKYEKKSV